MFARSGFLLVLALCLGSSECRLNEDDDLGTEEDLVFETLEYTNGADVQGDVSGIMGKRLLVIRDINEFTDMWSDHAAGRSPQPAQPTVAFGTDMVIAAFAGQRDTSGYSITIEEIRENDEFIVVEIEVETPGDNCAVTEAVTQPHHVVVIDDSDKPVQFSEATVEAAACTAT